MKQQFKRFLTAILLATLMLTGCASETSTKSEPKTNEVAKEKKTENKNKEENKKTQTAQQKTPNKETPAPVTTTPTTSFSLASIPAYSGKPYVAVNDNKPFFPNNLSNKPFESYSNLDQLGRCGVATACITKALMPTTKRGSIASVKPSGWQTVRYEVVGKGSSGYLYNRCHLIGYQLTGENANVKNLITGTRYLNIEGMLPFENMVTDYIKETNQPVYYRVTPIFDGNNLVASGVLMEAKSLADNGASILFNVFCYNVQPGVNINYANGTSSVANTSNSSSKQQAQTTKQAKSTPQPKQNTPVTASYIGNKNTRKFHRGDCRMVARMSQSNKVTFNNRDSAVSQGYNPCKICNP